MEGFEDCFIGGSGDGAIYQVRGNIGEETGLEGMFFVAGARWRGDDVMGWVIGLECSHKKLSA